MRTEWSMTAILDTLDTQVAVIDSVGTIHFVNRAWCEFSRENGLPADYRWVGRDYLNVCTPDDAAAQSSADGMRSVIQGKAAEYFYEYPCHSPTEQRWFMMRCAPMHATPGFFVVAHRNITQNKLAEEIIQRQNSELARLASTDPLTQLANRLKLNTALDAEIYRAKRYTSPLAVILLDVDHFKSVNDVHGHPVGDAVLSGIAEILGASVRNSDIAGRWGGEEFLIILPGCNLEAGQQLAEKLRRTIAAREFQLVGHVTCSFGVAELHHGDSAAALVSHSDAALYCAKRRGRNCVCTVNSV